MGGSMSSVVISGDTSGAITLAAPAVAGTNTINLPAAAGTVMVSGNMPAFSAYSNSAQTISAATFTKIQFNTELFDTNSNYDVGTYRFTPTVAGYYQVNTSVNFGTARSLYILSIYKNNSRGTGGENTFAGSLSANTSLNCQNIVYMNGSSDYLEVFAYVDSGTNAINTGTNNTYFSSSMLRAA